MNNVKQRAAQLNISLTELSFMSRIGQATISKIVNGKIHTYPSWRKRIADALETTESELFPDIKD